MKDRLFSRSYICILAANFLLFFGFWLLMPVLPFYLKETFGCGEAVLGVILSCYTASGLCARPFSGYLMDEFPRKPIYIMCYFICASIFVGYIAAGVLTWFIVLRMLHGVAFSWVTVGGNTLCVDITPSSRRGEALGYYGLTNNTAMALGPMTGLFMHDHITYSGIFITGMVFSLTGFVFAMCVKPRTPESRRIANPPQQIANPPQQSDATNGFRRRSIHCSFINFNFSFISRNWLDRFVLIKGIPVSVSLLMLSIPYGATTNYVAMYAKEIGIPLSTGFFFTLMAIGMGVSRIFAGRQVDCGYVTQCIHIGYYPVIAAFLLLGACRFIADTASLSGATVAFFTVPVLLGFGFGVMFPAMNTLYINLAPNNQRATATSTYLTAWDVGLGIGITAGGAIAQHFTFYMVYLIGSGVCLISLLFFVGKVTPHYYKNKVR